MHQLDVVYILSNKDFYQDRYAVLIFLYTQDWELMLVHKNFSIYSSNCMADLFLLFSESSLDFLLLFLYT